MRAIFSPSVVQCVGVPRSDVVVQSSESLSISLGCTQVSTFFLVRIDWTSIDVRIEATSASLVVGKGKRRKLDSVMVYTCSRNHHCVRPISKSWPSLIQYLMALSWSLLSRSIRHWRSTSSCICKKVVLAIGIYFPVFLAFLGVLLAGAFSGAKKGLRRVAKRAGSAATASNSSFWRISSSISVARLNI